MQVNNLRFNQEELDALENSRFFHVKHAAMLKLSTLFAELETHLQNTVTDLEKRHHEILKSGKGRIFRGENYKLLPYMVLDYPRQFSKESIFTFRSMFWWGNGFSFTLHLQGHAWEHFRKSKYKS